MGFAQVEQKAVGNPSAELQEGKRHFQNKLAARIVHV
jgi:hypothetical protein